MSLDSGEHESTDWRTEDPAVTERLQRLRRAFNGDNQTKFAQRIGVHPQRWHHVEKGGALSKQLAIELVRRIPGMSLDWLFFGALGNLSNSLTARLEGGTYSDGKPNGGTPLKAADADEA